MKSEDPIDDLLKRKLNEYNSVADDASWAAAAKLLDEAMPVKKKKRRGTWWVYLILVGVLGTGLFLLPNETRKSNRHELPSVVNSSSATTNSSQTNNTLLEKTTTPNNVGNNTNQNSELTTVAPSTKANETPILYVQNGAGKLSSAQTNRSTSLLVTPPQTPAEFTTTLQPKSSFLANVVKSNMDSTVALAAEDSLQAKDSVEEKQAKADSSKMEPIHEGIKKSTTSDKRWALQAEGGPVFWKSYINIADSGSSKTNPDYYVGASIVYRGNAHLWLRAGFFGIQQSRIKQTRVINQFTYGVSYQSEAYHLRTDKIFLFHIPVEGIYHLNKKQSFSAGFGADIVFDSRNTNTYSNYNEANQKSYTRTYKTGGYRKGFTDIGFTATLGYQFQLTQAFGLVATGHFGLSDITKNYYYRNANKDYNRGLRLGIVYTFYSF